MNHEISSLTGTLCSGISGLLYSGILAPFAQEWVAPFRQEYPFKNTLTIRLIKQDVKGRYDLVNWPNFFIGIEETGDTVGIIEYESNLNYKRGEALSFKPGKVRNSIEEQLDSEMDLPVFKVSKKPKTNNLYCSVKKIYYAMIIEQKNGK